MENVRIRSGNVTLNVKSFNGIQSESIVLLHGGPGVPDDMTEVRDWLSQHMQVITFDQRGTGNGVYDNCTFSLPEYVNDLEKIAAHFGLERFHLFGHSWGGVYAQLFAIRHPEKVLSMFLCSPAPGTGKIWSMAEREIFRYNFRRSSLTEWMGMAFNSVLGILGNSGAYRKLFRQLIINYHKGYGVDPPDADKLERIGARAGIRTRHEIKKYPELESFGKTPYPVIITYGESDTFGKSREHLLKRFPYARKVIIPSSGHTPWKHNLREFQKVLQSFY